MKWWGLRGCERSTHCTSSFLLARPSVTTHDPPSATGCRRMLEPGTLQFNYCAAHWWSGSIAFEGFPVEDETEAIQYSVTGPLSLQALQHSKHPLLEAAFLAARSTTLLSAQGLLRLWLQVRSAANVGCAHPIESTRRHSYIIALVKAHSPPPNSRGHHRSDIPRTLLCQRAPWRFPPPTTVSAGACSRSRYSQHLATMRATRRA
jgi:hypothetical protein